MNELHGIFVVVVVMFMVTVAGRAVLAGIDRRWGQVACEVTGLAVLGCLLAGWVPQLMYLGRLRTGAAG